MRRKNIGCKWGSPKTFLQVCSDGIRSNANGLPECQKPAFLTCRKIIVSQGSMPRDPLLYYVPRNNYSTQPKCKICPPSYEQNLLKTTWLSSLGIPSNAVIILYNNNVCYFLKLPKFPPSSHFFRISLLCIVSLFRQYP